MRVSCELADDGVGEAAQAAISLRAGHLGSFHTMGIGMIAGRDFTSLDPPRESSTIAITDSLAKRLCPNRSPIGDRILIGCQAQQASVVIGVVRDSTVRDAGEPPQPRCDRPFARQYDGGLSAVLLETGTARHGCRDGNGSRSNVSRRPVTVSRAPSGSSRRRRVVSERASGRARMTTARLSAAGHAG